MQKVLTVRLLVKDDGTVVLERATGALDRLGRETNEAAAATRNLSSTQAGMLGSMKSLVGVVGGLVGAGALGMLIRETYQYNQQVESTKIGIAGLLSANRTYAGAQDQWTAALSESEDLLKRIQVESLKTKATVPQLGDAFATTFGAATAAGLRTTNEEILQMTTRLTQVGNAFGVPMEQMRQEINSLVGGMVTEDSLIAKRLGFDSKSVKEMQRNGTFVIEVVKRTEAYAKAAEAQSNTLSGKLLNTKEIIVSTFSRGLDASFQGLKKHLDAVFSWFSSNGDQIIQWMQRTAGAVEAVVGKTVAWVRGNQEVLAGFVALGAAAVTLSAVQTGVTLIGAALTGAIAPAAKLMLTMAAIVAVWEGVRKLAGIEVGGRPIAGYIQWVVTAVVGIIPTLGVAFAGALKSIGAFIKSALGNLALGAAQLARSIGDLVGSETMTKWASNAEAFWKPFSDPSYERAAGVFRGAADDVRGAMAIVSDAAALGLEKKTLPGFADMVKFALSSMAGAFDQYLPKITGGIATVTGAAGTVNGAPGGAVGVGGVAGPVEALPGVSRTYLDVVMEGERKRAAALKNQVLAYQMEIEELRLGVIDDSIERELQMQLKKNAEWLEGEIERIKAEGGLLEEAEKHKGELDEFARARARTQKDEQTRLQREQLVGTREWAKKMAAEIGTVPQQMTRLIGEATLQLAGLFDDLLSNVITGQKKLGESLSDFAKGLGRTWARMLSDMVAKSIIGKESILTQLKEVWASLGNVSGPMDAGLQGGAVGSFVGSVFQGPNNYAGVGGTAGGALGAVVGAYFGGPTGAKIGTAIGSAIGTAIGSMIQKGTDQIQVAIRDNVATVTENGISAKARREIEVQVQRQVKEQTKAWQSILDLFPENVQAALAKLAKPKVNLTGGVEDADITDQGALNSLTDFLGNDLPTATFQAYTQSIQTALNTMGVQGTKIAALFTYWGTLQGKELQEAVRQYVVTMVEGIDLRDKLGAPIGTRIDESRRLSGMTSLGAMDEVRGQMATLVASASKLTDIEDIVAAQGQLNQLGRQYYDMGIARLQRIDGIEKSILATNGQIREQINLAGMDDQGKIDYYYQGLASLRGQLGKATDPEEIQRISAQMQQYVQAAFGLAPDNKENRDKLLAILGDIEGISSEQLQVAREQQAAKDAEAFDLMKQQLEALMGIRTAIENPPVPNPVPVPMPIPQPQPVPGPGPVKVTSDQVFSALPMPMLNPPSKVDELMKLQLDALMGIRTSIESPAKPVEESAESLFAKIDQMQQRRDELMRMMPMEMNAAMPKASDFAEAVRNALSGARFNINEPIEINNGDLAEGVRVNAVRDVLLVLRDSPDAAIPRT